MNHLSNRYSFSTPQGTTHIYYYDNMICVPEIKKQRGRYNALYVCDEHTLPLLQKAAHFIADIPLVCLPAGEEHKHIQNVEKIIEIAIQAELDRNTIFIAFGGGVICDMTALAASLYMRGVTCILVPSTLLAMADASIGGKTAVNFLQYKNLIGTFYTASVVFICLPLLQTLAETEYHAGLAEVLKIGVLYDPSIYRIFLENPLAIMQRDIACVGILIRRSTQAKARVISQDFTEQGERSFLNFGHTFAHALESISHFSILHGDAVAWGMARSLAIGCLLTITDSGYAEDVTKVLRTYGWCTAPLYPTIPFVKNTELYADSLLTAIKKDKKKAHGSIRLVLQKNIQKNLILEVDETLIRKVLR